MMGTETVRVPPLTHSSPAACLRRPTDLHDCFAALASPLLRLVRYASSRPHPERLILNAMSDIAIEVHATTVDHHAAIAALLGLCLAQGYLLLIAFS
jgi:hypothetical protein